MPRMHVSFNGGWDFFPDPDQCLSLASLEEAGPPRVIQVPGPWQAQFEDLRDFSGVAWYRYRFHHTADSFPRPSPTFQPSYLLHFGAVDYYTTAWLNGAHIGSHEGGYLPFEFSLDDALRDGVNELIVRVVDPGSDVSRFPEYPFEEIPHGKQSWYGPIGGIWQSVAMEVRHIHHLLPVRVTPDVPGEQATVRLAMNAPASADQTVRLTLTDPKGATREQQVTIPVGADILEVVVPVPAPMLWDTRTPHLYGLEATLLDSADQPLDRVETAFGMRTITTSDNGHLMLNGRILYLRGALDQDYYPEMIYTPFSDAELDDQFAKAKHMGLNCLRTHIKITDPRYYAAADRAGLLIWTELPNWINLTETTKARALETLQGMVERDWNHPSIIIWTIINEGWGVDLAVQSDHRAWLAEMYALLKALDPHRLVVGNSPCYGNYHVVTDIQDFHNYYAIPDHYEQWRDWVASFASRPDWTYAPEYEDVHRWREYMREPWNPAPRPLAPEVSRRGNEPMVVSEFGNWGLPDVAKLREGYGGKEPWWFETGQEWGDGVAYPHGIEGRFKQFHLDKVFPTLLELSAASQRMQFTALKYEIEQMRRYPSIVGYVITEFTDVHWEANGLLDICRNPKAYYDVIGQINSADALVPDSDRIVYWEGERCELRLTLSHFGTDDLRGSRLCWRLDLAPEINGCLTGLRPTPAQVTPLGTISFTVPSLPASERARLEFWLEDAQGRLITRNHQELYFFPRSATGYARGLRLWAPELATPLAALGYTLTDDLESADLVVAQTMTDALRAYVQRGGHVLWLAESGEHHQAPLGTITIQPREGRSWSGDWASNFNWIRQDTIFQAIPTGGTVDFAFADLIPDWVIAGLSPRDFAADVHAGLFVGWIHHTVALVAERRFGQGRLLISTFRLSEHLTTNPVAQIMFADMAHHLARRASLRPAAPHLTVAAAD